MMRIETREGWRGFRACAAIVALAVVSACGQEQSVRKSDSIASAPGEAGIAVTPKGTGASISKSTGSDSSAATGQSATAPANSAPASIAAASTVPRVVLIGTSLTAGLGLDPSEAYPALLQKLADSLHYRVNIVNAGLSGETLAGALRRANWVLEQPTAAVVLEVGANDGLRGVDPDSTRASIEALIDTIRKKQPAASIYLVQMEAQPNFGRDYTTRFHNMYRRAATKKRVELLPFLLDSVAGISELNQGDGIHPNRRGAHIVARNMLRGLTPLFRKLSPATSTTSTTPGPTFLPTP